MNKKQEIKNISSRSTKQAKPVDFEVIVKSSATSLKDKKIALQKCLRILLAQNN